ncbi:DUF6188 family protein [Gordonia iterans]
MTPPPIEGIADGRSFRVDPRDGSPEIEDIALLVGKTVVSAEYYPDNTLEVAFDRGANIRIVPNNEGYDSWSVTYPPDRILVGNPEFA